MSATSVVMAKQIVRYISKFGEEVSCVEHYIPYSAILDPAVGIQDNTLNITCDIAIFED